MSAYLVVTLSVTDAETYRRYAARTPEVIARHGGRFLTRGTPVETLEGAAFGGRMVIAEFPDARSARAFYDDPEYQELSVYRREGSSGGLMLLQDGVADGARPDPGV